MPDGGEDGGGSTGGMRNVLALGAVSFFTDVSTEMILGLLPVFIVEDLGASRAILGLIEGTADAVNYLLRVASGVISDRLGVRKAVVLAGYAVSNFAKPALALVRDWIGAFAVRLTDRVGKGIRTSARDALLSESVGEARLGRAFGIHRSMDQMGAVIGPLAAAALVPVVGERGVFLASIVPGALALVVLTLFVSERRGGEGNERGAGGLRNAGEILRGGFSRFLVPVALFSAGAYSFSFVLVRARDAGFAVVAVPLIYAAMNLVHAAAAVPAGRMADRVGSARALAAGYVTLAAASSLGLAGLSRATVMVMALIFGVYMGTVETVQRAAVAKFAPGALRGTAYGLYYLAVGAATAAANLAFGLLWDRWGASAAFSYSIVTSLAAAALMLGVREPGRGTPSAGGGA